jgi:hypothetical protein
MLKRLFDAESAYQRRARRVLDEARMAALEHETAAEYHAALGAMYRDRAMRLERELSGPPAEQPLILDPSLHPRVATLRRGNDSSAAQTFLGQGGAAATK